MTKHRVLRATHISEVLTGTHALMGVASLLVCTMILASMLLITHGNTKPNSQTADAPKPVPSLHDTQKGQNPQEAVHKPPSTPIQCPHGSVLTIVAHEDDDILFMNPALQEEIRSGMCIRTIYITAGDNGLDTAYWQRRESAPDTAYAIMSGAPDNWQHTTVLVAGRTLSAHFLVDRPQISLIFLRLPDGNTTGQGFGSSNYESLQKLRTGDINTIHALDGTNTYTRAELIDTLRAFMVLDKPSIINTQAFSDTLATGDHSDHQTVGYFTNIARQSYRSNAALHRYLGYQAGLMPINLTDEQIAGKKAVFDAYEQGDEMICNSTDGCFNSFVYQDYLSRQYEQE